MSEDIGDTTTSVTAQSAVDPREYYWSNGSLKWGTPINVGHLILQLQTLDPAMKVSSITFIDMPKGRKARAYGLSMSYERWDELGWLDFTLPGPKCLALWATERESVPGLAPLGERPRQPRKPTRAVSPTKKE